MTKDEALRKALEALENASNNSAAWNQKLEAITAIKEALAQPEQDWIERERAVGYREGHQNALKQMAQPEQEPVAWMDSDGNVSDNNDHGCFSIPLYTLQPQREWVGLTDEQIDAEHDRLFPKPAFNFDRQNVRNFARVIEAKLKQKNGFAEEENT